MTQFTLRYLFTTEKQNICSQRCRMLIAASFVTASLAAQMAKNLPVMQETQVRSLGREDPLEKGLATLASFLVWKIPWTEEPGELQSTGSQRVGHEWLTQTQKNKDLSTGEQLNNSTSIQQNTAWQQKNQLLLPAIWTNLKERKRGQAEKGYSVCDSFHMWF